MGSASISRRVSPEPGALAFRNSLTVGGCVNRRRFIKSAVAASSLSLLRIPGARGADSGPTPRRILILGGTSFLGPAVVRAAVIAGHTVTLFNRGITNPELFPNLEKLRGLRSPTASEENWATVGSRRWDAVIDVWPSDPSLAASAALRLRDQAAHYLYVSSIATYVPRGFSRPNLTEEAPLNPWDPAIRPYDRGKAESERRLQTLVGERLTVVRPGPIKGDRDDTPDLLAWLRRSQRGGRHIGPGSGDDHVQIVDVKDVAQFLVLAIERSLHGAFNLTGHPHDVPAIRGTLQPGNPLSRRVRLDSSRLPASTGPRSRAVQLPDDSLIPGQLSVLASGTGASGVLSNQQPEGVRGWLDSASVFGNGSGLPVVVRPGGS